MAEFCLECLKKFEPNANKNNIADKINENTEAIVTIEDALCETEIYSDERISAIEDALCELSMLLEI